MQIAKVSGLCTCLFCMHIMLVEGFFNLSSLQGISLAGASRPPAWWPTVPPTLIEPNSTSQYYDKSTTQGRSAIAPAPPTADRLDYCSQSPLQLRLSSFGGAKGSAKPVTNETCSPLTALTRVLKEAYCEGLAASHSTEPAVAHASGNDSSEEPSSLSSIKGHSLNRSVREITSKSSTSAASMAAKTDDCSGITKTLEPLSNTR